MLQNDGMLQIPGCKSEQHAGVVHQQTGCVQEGPEPAQLPQEAQVLRGMQLFALNVLSVCRKVSSWGSAIKVEDVNRRNKLMRKAGGGSQ